MYQRGEGCEDTCTSNDWDELSTLNPKPNFPGGIEAFLNKWNEAIQALEDLDRRSGRIRTSEFLERTVLKEAVVDPGF